MNGVRRGKGARTTVPAKDGRRAGDLLDRDFTAPAPNIRRVADFLLQDLGRFVYVAFVVDVFAQRIVGWHAATTKVTDLVLTPLRIALWDRDRQRDPGRAGSAAAPLRCLVSTHPSGSPAPRAGGHRSLDRHRGRCLPQRPDGIDHRTVQDRGDRHDRLPRRPLHAPTACPRPGSADSWPGTGWRARLPSNPAHDDPRPPHPGRCPSRCAT